MTPQLLGTDLFSTGSITTQNLVPAGTATACMPRAHMPSNSLMSTAEPSAVMRTERKFEHSACQIPVDADAIVADWAPLVALKNTTPPIVTHVTPSIVPWSDSAPVYVPCSSSRGRMTTARLGTTSPARSRRRSPRAATVLAVYPGVTSAANAAVSYPLPRTWRVAWTIGGTTPSFSITSVQVGYIR